MSKAKLQMTY